VFRFLQQTTYCSSGNAGSDQVSSGTVVQLSRVQGSNLDIFFNKVEEAYLDQAVSNETAGIPSVNFSLDYIATAGYNEQRLGLVTDGINSAFLKLNQTKDFYVKNESDPVDANFTNTSAKTVIGIGNALFKSYSIQGQVGDLLKVNCDFEALNCAVYTGTSGQQVPSIDVRQDTQYNSTFVLPVANSLVYTSDVNSANNVTALGSKDLLMEFPSGSIFATAVSGDGCILQSFSLSFEIPRLEVRELGSRFPVERPMTIPIRINLSAEAIMNSYQIEKLNNVVCDTGHDINILIKQPCSDLLALEFYLRGMRLESQSFSNSIEGYQTVSINWNGIVGDLRDSGKNLFIYAHNGSEYYIVTSKKYISGTNLGEDDFAAIEQVTFQRYITQNEYISGNNL
jgi:hypothetical protein